MVVLSAEFAIELKTLRKGRGIYVPQISERVGPALREVCGVAAGDTAGDMRRKVAARLQEMCASLPQDLQVAVLAALAIHPEAKQPFYQDRIRWVARFLERDERTARRRVDDGIAQLAELATSVPSLALNGVPSDVAAPNPLGWRVVELKSIVLVGGPATEAIELRRIVVERDGVEELEFAYSLPRDPSSGSSGDRDGRPEPVLEVLYGGTLVQRHAESSERVGYALRLPRPLTAGELYEYGIRVRAPEGQPIRPHYTCVSKRPYDRFDLRLRFARPRLPEQVWKLDNAFQRDVDDPVPTGEPLAPDAAGEVHLTFRHLTPGLAYGVRWAG